MRLPLRGLASAALWDTVVISGLALVEEELEEERARVCGPRAMRISRSAGRCGVGTPKARWCWATGEGATAAGARHRGTGDERALDQMVLGVSTRRYGRSLEPLGESVGVGGTGNSAVSERFTAETGHKLAELMGRELSGFKLAVLMSDGVHFAEHVVGSWSVDDVVAQTLARPEGFCWRPFAVRHPKPNHAHLPASDSSPRNSQPRLVRVVRMGVKSESYDPTTTEVALLRVSPMLYATRDDPTLLATKDAANL